MKDMEGMENLLGILPDRLKKWVNSWPNDLKKYATVMAIIALTKGVSDEDELQAFVENDPRMQIILMNMLYHAGGKSTKFMENMMDKLQPEAAVLVKAPTEDIIGLELSKRMPEIRKMLKNMSDNKEKRF